MIIEMKILSELYDLFSFTLWKSINPNAQYKMFNKIYIFQYQFIKNRSYHE